MSKIGQSAIAHAGETVKRLNPHLFHERRTKVDHYDYDAAPPYKYKRVRQSSKPLMNKLESEFYLELQRDWPGYSILVQAMKLRLANGVWLCPDFVVCGVRLKMFEVKGPHMWEDAAVKLKFAATAYRDFDWLLVWKKDGDWHEQEILP